MHINIIHMIGAKISSLERLQRRSSLDTTQPPNITDSAQIILWMFSLLNTITKHEPDKYDRPICLWATTSHHKIPVQGEKVTYTSVARVRGRDREGKMPFECVVEAFNCSPENSEGICIVKSLRGERWGTLTSSLWAEESHINCSAGRQPSLSMGFRLQCQVKYHGLGLNN